MKKDQLILVDRGYSRAAGVAKVLQSGAALLMRWHTTALPLPDPHSRALNLLALPRGLPEHNAGHWKVQFFHQGKVYRLRLCAIGKNRLATERVRCQVLDNARFHGYQASAASLELAEYILVLTTLPKEFTASQALTLYRCRWQVELAFKRLKSLLSAGAASTSLAESAVVPAIVPCHPSTASTYGSPLLPKGDILFSPHAQSTAAAAAPLETSLNRRTEEPKLAARFHSFSSPMPIRPVFPQSDTKHSHGQAFEGGV